MIFFSIKDFFSLAQPFHAIQCLEGSWIQEFLLFEFLYYFFLDVREKNPLVHPSAKYQIETERFIERQVDHGSGAFVWYQYIWPTKPMLALLKLGKKAYRHFHGGIITKCCLAVN